MLAGRPGALADIRLSRRRAHAPSGTNAAPGSEAGNVPALQAQGVALGLRAISPLD
jgi:hypothetical protein